MIRIDGIDHVVLTARDVEDTCRFYERVLGMSVTTFAGGRKALTFGRQKINLHQAGREFEPCADRPEPGTLDLCLLTRTPMDDVRAHLERGGVAILGEPSIRTGAGGQLLSVYLRDPDGNLVEVSNLLGPVTS
ncbi:MAG: VOC family protein [Betaproteobacteria bacterium]